MVDKILKSVELVAVDKNFAVGNDIVFIPDFEKSLTPLFKGKVFTAAETTYCELFDNTLLRYASTWAAKEAVYKAIKQLNSAALPWKKIEITRDKVAGKPSVTLANHEEPISISLSISHDGDYVWAVAIVEKI